MVTIESQPPTASQVLTRSVSEEKYSSPTFTLSPSQIEIREYVSIGSENSIFVNTMESHPSTEVKVSTHSVLEKYTVSSITRLSPGHFPIKIGRASCRERVHRSWCAGR